MAADDIGDEKWMRLESGHKQDPRFSPILDREVFLAGNDWRGRFRFDEDEIFRRVHHADRARPIDWHGGRSFRFFRGENLAKSAQP